MSLNLANGLSSNRPIVSAIVYLVKMSRTNTNAYICFGIVMYECLYLLLHCGKAKILTPVVCWPCYCSLYTLHTHRVCMHVFVYGEIVICLKHIHMYIIYDFFCFHILFSNANACSALLLHINVYLLFAFIAVFLASL